MFYQTTPGKAEDGIYETVYDFLVGKGHKDTAKALLAPACSRAKRGSDCQLLASKCTGSGSGSGVDDKDD